MRLAQIFEGACQPHYPYFARMGLYFNPLNVAFQDQEVQED